jgi:hypothetical protein
MRKSIFRITFAFSAITSFIVFGAFAQKEGSPAPNPEENGWSVSYGPFTGSGFQNFEVGVVGILSTREKGVTGVIIKNRTKEIVNAIELTWYLTGRQLNGVIFEQGTTGIMELKEALQPGESITLNYNVAHLEKTRSFHEKELFRDYQIVVAVAEARFVNNKFWQIPAVTNLSVDGGYAVSKPLPPPACQNTQCVFTGMGGYSCEFGSSAPTNCSMGVAGMCVTLACEPGIN